MAKAFPIQISLSPATNPTESLQVTLTGGTDVNLGSSTTYTYTVSENNAPSEIKFLNLHPVASAMVSSGLPNTACGGCQTIDTGTLSSTNNQRSQYRFDLSSIPSGATVQKAEILGYLPYSVDSSGTGVLSTSAYLMLNSWAQAGATWNNSSGVAANVAATSSSNSNALNSGRWDVTADTQNIVNGAQTNNGWVLIGPENSPGQEFFRFYMNVYPVVGVQTSLFVTYSVQGAGQVSLSPPGLAFGSQNDGSPSSAQTLTLSNPGSAPVSINNVTITGANPSDFTQTNTCGTSVAVGGNCTISVTFTPSVVGAESASLSVTDGASDSPQTAALSGTGVAVSQASLTPASLGFGNQNVKTTSAAQTIDLSNPGSAALSITSIAITGTNAADFSATNTCGTSVPAGGNCTISVTFTPSVSGAESASLAVTDNAATSPQTAALSGTGVGVAQAVLTPPSLAFGNQNVKTTGAAQTINLSNPGSAALSITSVAITGTNAVDFSATNTCGSSVPAGGNCTISVTFTPSLGGAESASVAVTDNAAPSPQTAALSGTGVGVSQASLTPTSLSFGNQNVKTTSAAQQLILSNPGSAALSGITIGLTGTNPGDFSQTNTCGTSVAAGANCAISVTFTPQAVGARSASITVTDNAATSPQTAALSGSGVGVSQASLTPVSLSFGNQNVKTTSVAQTLTLSNSGSASLSISSIVITGINAADFSQTNTCGTGIAAGGNCAISVTFSPQAAGARTASVTVADNAAGSPQTAALSGTGVAVSQASLTPLSLAFGNQNLKTTSAAKTLTLSNAGTAALSITSIAVTGTNVTDFAQTNTCGSSVAAGGNCAISVTFSPQAAGTRTASVTVSDNAASSPQAAALSGTGVAVSQASLTPSSLAFGNQNLKTTSAARTLTLSNAGTAALSITSIAVTGTNVADFAQTNTCGSSVAAGGSCTISVRFSPQAAGARSAAIAVSDNAAGSPQTGVLSGTGVPVVLSPATVSFGNQALNTTSSSKAVKLQNMGSAAVSISSIAIAGANAGDFTETNGCGTSLAAGASCTITVKFIPKALGARSASVTVKDNAAGSPHTAALSGTGVPVALSPASLSFGSQTLNTTSSSKTIKLQNVGTAVITISSIAIAGTNAGDFSETNNCGSSLAAGASCAISVKFKPKATGARSASVAVKDNAAGSPHTAALSGTGVT